MTNRRSVLLSNFVLNGQESASNPLLHIHAKRYGTVVKKAKLVFLGFCAFGDWKRKLSVCCGTEKWKVSWKATVERNKKEKINKKTKNLDADCSGLCSFGANGTSAESAWILSLTVFALWLRPTRNGIGILEVQARNVKRNWSFLFLKWKWILLGNGSKFWKIKNWPQQNREKRSPGWNCDHLHKIGEIG